MLRRILPRSAEDSACCSKILRRSGRIREPFRDSTWRGKAPRRVAKLYGPPEDCMRRPQAPQAAGNFWDAWENSGSRRDLPQGASEFGSSLESLWKSFESLRSVERLSKSPLLSLKLLRSPHFVVPNHLTCLGICNPPYGSARSGHSISRDGARLNDAVGPKLHP